MERSADFVAPPHWQIAAGEIGKINKINTFLLGEHTSAITVVETGNSRQADTLLNIRFDTSVGTVAAQYPFDTPLVIYRESGKTRL